MRGDRAMVGSAKRKAAGLPCRASARVVDDASGHDNCYFAPRFRGLAE